MNTSRISYAINQGPRENLEDDWSACQIRCLPAGNEVTSLIVCDGVGGNNFGEVASHQATATFNAYMAAGLASYDSGREGQALTPNIIRDMIIKALEQANQSILQRIAAQRQLTGMSTTAVAALLAGNTLYVAWAGDSRGYLYRHGQLLRMTSDHSEVQRLITAGIIHESQAKKHPLAHAIYRFLGQASDFAVETRSCSLHSGDIILLCTDGLTDVLTDEQIAEEISIHKNKAADDADLAASLVEKALQTRTRDNVTVVCCHYQPRAKPTNLYQGLTLTGAYLATMAKARHYQPKEHCHESIESYQ